MKHIAVELDNDRTRADDRPLGWTGEFMHGSFSEDDVAQYPSAMSALNAASRATNSRPDCIVSAVAQGRKVHA